MAYKSPYEDIINLPPHISKKHPQPTMLERAARFSPFAAITGYEEMVKEAARVTDKRVELDESSKEILNEKLLFVMEMFDEDTVVNITYFIPDKLHNAPTWDLNNPCRTRCPDNTLRVLPVRIPRRWKGPHPVLPL